MGDAADMLLDGTLDCETGEVFEDVLEGAPPPGYPRCMADDNDHVTPDDTGAPNDVEPDDEDDEEDEDEDLDDDEDEEEDEEEEADEDDEEEEAEPAGGEA